MSLILSKPNEELSESEKYYLWTYNQRNPLLDTDCEMNRLCHYIESIDFDVKSSILKSKGDIYGEYLNPDVEWNQLTYTVVLSEVKRFFKELRDDIQMRSFQEDFAKYVPEEETRMENKYDIFKERMIRICSNTDELVNYLIKAFYVDYRSISKDFLWKCYGKVIFANFLSRHQENIFIPVLDENGEYQYLFDKYSIVEVSPVGQ